MSLKRFQETDRATVWKTYLIEKFQVLPLASNTVAKLFPLT